MAITTSDMQTLLQTLPQELYGKIFEEVFTADSHDRIISEDYTPPAQLQVSSALRERFAESYYGNGATFVFPQGLSIEASASDAKYDTIGDNLRPDPPAGGVQGGANRLLGLQPSSTIAGSRRSRSITSP